MVEADVLGPGSVNGVMSGKHYNRCVHIHKLMYEVLQKLRFDSFLQSLDEEEELAVNSTLRDLRNAFENDEFENMLNSFSMGVVERRYSNFVEQCRRDNPTFDFWSTYIDMIGINLAFLTSYYNLGCTQLFPSMF